MNDKNEKYIVDVGRFMLLFVGIDVLLTSVLLLFHVSISKLNFFLGLVISILVYFLFFDNNLHRKRFTIVISCGFLLFIIIGNSLLYEIAYDGNLYHKFAVGILKMGYNPVYDKVEEYLTLLNIPLQSWHNDQIWVASYPKAAWYFDAGVYAITDWIESAKIFNAIIFISSFGICYNYFFYKLQKTFAYMITFLLVATPTSVSMLLNFYLDGALGNLLITSIILLMSITDDAYTENKLRQFAYLGICIILCGNLKVTGLAYEGIFCFVFFIMWIVHLLKKSNRYIVIKKIGYVLLFYIGVVSIAVLVVGYGTYITNIINYGNILYPLGGLEGFDVSNNLKSVGLNHASPLIQILSMIFVKTNTNNKLSHLEWKIPFSFEMNEIDSSVYDVIRGGAGFLYSGIFCVAVIMFWIWNWKFRKNNDINKQMVYLIMLVSFGLMCVIPAGGQIRYSPYMFYFVSFTIYLWMLGIRAGCIKSRLSKKIPCIMFILLLLNVMPFTKFTMRVVEETIDYSSQFDDIAQKGGAYIDTELPGIVFNFIDRDIEYTYDTESELNDGTMRYYHLNYNYMN